MPRGRQTRNLGPVYGSKVTLPRTLVEPVAGRFAFEFTVGLVVAPTQNAEPSLMAFGTPTERAPDGRPTSRISCTSVPARLQTPPVPQSAALTQPRPMFVPALQ